MRRNRLYCEKCGARESKLEIVAKVPKAKCLACGASIPLIKDVYGNWSPVRVVKVA